LVPYSPNTHYSWMVAFHKQLDAVYAKHKPLTGDQSSAKLTE